MIRVEIPPKWRKCNPIIERGMEDLEFDTGEDCSEADSGGSIFALFGKGRKVLGGGGLFLACMWALVWNEGLGKKANDLLGEALDSFAVASIQTLDSALDDKLVHIAGTVTAREPASDPVFGVNTRAAGLHRQVYMYQWIEYAYTDENDKPIFEYEQNWSARFYDSSEFNQPSGHENPKPVFDTTTHMASDAKLGPYRLEGNTLLTQGLRVYDLGYAEENFNEEEVLPSLDLEGISGLSDLSAWPRQLEALPALPAVLIEQGWIADTESGVYYKSRSQGDEPRLGDVMVRFAELPVGQELSILAQQDGKRLVPWLSSAGDAFFIVHTGIVSAKAMLADKLKANQSLVSSFRWTLLILGTLGLAAFASAAGGFMRNIPIIGRIAQTSLWLCGAVVGLICGIFAIMIGWFSARPWVAYTVLGLLLSLAIWRFLEYRKKRAQTQISARAVAASSKARELEFARASQRGPTLPPALPVAAGGAASGRAAFKVAELPARPPPPPVAAKMAANAEPPAPSTPFGSRAPLQGAANDDVDLPPLEFSGGSTAMPSMQPQPAGAGLLTKIALTQTLTRALTEKPAPAHVPPPFNGPAAISDDLPPLEFEPSGFRNPVPIQQPKASPASAALTPAAPIKPLLNKPLPSAPPAAAMVKAPAPPVVKAEANKDQLSSNNLPFDSAKKFEQVSFVDDFLALNGGVEEAESEPVQRHIPVAQRGDFRVVKVVQDDSDGEKTLHFELYRRETLLKQGGQAEIQAEAKRVIAAAG